MKWFEVQIKTTIEAEDAITNIFYEAGAEGVAIESLNDLIIMQKEENFIDYIDESLMEMDPQESLIKGYLKETDNYQESINYILEHIKLLPQCGLNPGSCELLITEVEQEEWANSWKKYYKTTKIGSMIVIKPSWEEYKKKDKEIIIEIDPGMAFGTGTHETTKLCVESLEKNVKTNDVVLDIGCGSGILSLVAAKLDAQKVIAVDLDSVAVRVTNENIENNNMQHIIEVREGDLLEVVSEKVDIVVANILADVIIKLAKQIKPYINKNGLFISSGIINDRLNDVKNVIENEGFIIEEINKMGEWASIVARMK